MVGSVGSPMRSQSLARLHAVREIYVIKMIIVVIVIIVIVIVIVIAP